MSKYVEKTGRYNGFEYAVSVNPKMGFRCGYVAFPKDWKRKHNPKDCWDLPYSVHGGITYGRFGYPWKAKMENYVAGFDCGHYGDGVDPTLIDPKVYGMTSEELNQYLTTSGFLKCAEGDHMWTIEEVEDECKSLIDQIIAEGEAE